MTELSIKNYSGEDLGTSLRLNAEFADSVYVRVESTKPSNAVSMVFFYPFKKSVVPLGVVNQRTGGFSIDTPYGYEGPFPQKEAAKYLAAVDELAKGLYDNPDNMLDDSKRNAWMAGRQLGTVVEKLNREAYPIIDKEHQN